MPTTSLKARLQSENKSCISTRGQDLDQLEAKLIPSLGGRAAWTGDDIVNRAKRMVFKSRRQLAEH